MFLIYTIHSYNHSDNFLLNTVKTIVCKDFVKIIMHAKVVEAKSFDVFRQDHLFLVYDRGIDWDTLG